MFLKNNILNTCVLFFIYIKVFKYTLKLSTEITLVELDWGGVE